MKTLLSAQEIAALSLQYPLITDLVNTREVFWTNPDYDENWAGRSSGLGIADIDDAESRLVRFAPFIARHFPDSAAMHGIVESPVRLISSMQRRMAEKFGVDLPGRLFAKLDSHLPISGSIKARGGVYEVLHFAEEVVHRHFGEIPDYACLADSKYRRVLARYTMVVGSTGNLGLSIGIMGAALGFRVVVHMSDDAKRWKKEMLRGKGVVVVEHASDYSSAVVAGRKAAEKDPLAYFVDDENSRHLFLGYAVAARRLARQLENQGVVVDEAHPLFVYLPCGVGGAPGGVTFGLKTVYGRNVHCFFAEPTHSPAMLLGLMTGLHDRISVQDFGIDNLTAADGLAVGRQSGFVGRALQRDIAGVLTVSDACLFRLLKSLGDTEGIFLEPSALAGFPGMARLLTVPAGRAFLRAHQLEATLTNATHLAWGTGGNMVPKAEMEAFFRRGSEVESEACFRSV